MSDRRFKAEILREVQRLLAQRGVGVFGGVSDGDKGDVTVSGGGAVWTIDNGAVTLAKVANLSANTFLANVTGSPATAQQIATSRIPLFGSAITGTPSASTYLRGDGSWATVSGGVSDGDKGDITVSGSGATWTIDNSAVTLGKIANIANATILGNNSGGSAAPIALTASQTKTLLAITNADVSGLGTLATQNGTFSGTSSGTNTGDQTITLTGDVTGSGTGSFAATIANDAVTYAKMQNSGAGNVVLARAASGAGDYGEVALGASELLGRGSTGNIAAITLGSNLSMSGTTLNATGGGGVSDGDKGDITVSGSGATWTIDSQAVTYAKVQNVAANSFLANATGSAATVQEIATTRIPLFGSAITGTPSASTYLRGDGSWQTPAGGSGPILTFAIHADATANVTLTNQVSGEQFLANNNRNITRADLTGFTEAKLVARVVTASASPNDPRIRLTYDLVSGGFSTTIGNYTNAAASGEIACSLATAGVIDSGWVALAAGALADVYLAVTQIGGNGAADPALGNVTLYIR